MKDFPPEILSVITASLQSKKDLKALRLVAKVFDDAAVPLLFDSIFIIARYADLEIASRVALRFGRFVKKILLSSKCYTPIATVEHYLRVAESRWEQMKALCLPKDQLQAHSQLYDQFQAYGQLYCQLARGNDEMARNGLLMSKLCHFIKILPKLRTVVLTDALCRPKEGCRCIKSYSETRERSHSPVDYMALRRRASGDSVKVHTEIECITPWSGLDLWENNLWPILIEAMHATGITTIKEILVETTGQELTTAVFRYTTLQADLVSVVAPNLTRLHLALNVSAGHNGAVSGLLSWHDGLRRTLSAAINLESLNIRCNTGWRAWPFEMANWDRTSLFGLMLLGCNFPKLTAFSSNDLSISESDALAFLGAHLGLKHLSMRNVTMISGSWRRTIQNLKDKMQLATIDMRGISGGAEEEEVHFRYEWADEEFTKGLQGFISGDSEDPISRQTLDRALLKRHRYLPDEVWEEWASRAWNW